MIKSHEMKDRMLVFKRIFVTNTRVDTEKWKGWSQLDFNVSSHVITYRYIYKIHVQFSSVIAHESHEAMCEMKHCNTVYIVPVVEDSTWNILSRVKLHSFKIAHTTVRV